MKTIPTLDSEDVQIERGELDAPEENMFYPKSVLDILGVIHRKKKYARPRGKQSPKFSNEEVNAIADLLFFKPRNIVLKIYKRVPQKTELPLKRQLFLKHFLGAAMFNGAKAARMAGYSPRSAKQIAYKLMRS
jgi:hypothetical protein